MEKVGVQQEQVHDILFNRKIDWQEIIYDLINTEQLDPWNVDIAILSNRYLEKIKDLEEADFFVSSKVLLAASLLLRIKSEILMSRYIKSIDEILFGKKEEKKYSMERIELEEEVPELVPRSPMPRFKKVTLNELMNSLNKAIKTENRRIKKEITKKNALRESGFSLPRKKISIKDKIKNIFDKINFHFKKNNKKIHYHEVISREKKERISSFGPLLHLEQQQKIWLEQREHFGEIHIWEKKHFFEKNGNPYEEIEQE